MSGRKARELRAKRRREYEFQLERWKSEEPFPIFFISHYFWKKRKPKEVK